MSGQGRLLQEVTLSYIPVSVSVGIRCSGTEDKLEGTEADGALSCWSQRRSPMRSWKAAAGL